MEKILLDTDVTLDLLCGERATVEKLRYYANREEICISVFTAFQLSTAIKNVDTMSTFLSNIAVLPFDRKAAIIASRLVGELKEKGIKVHIDSLLTAATCLAQDAFLFTKNRSAYEGIKGLKLV